MDLTGGDRGLGHGSISENPKWVTYRDAQKWRFFAFLGYFWWKFFLRRLWCRKDVHVGSFFAQKGATFQIFRQLRRRKMGHLSILATPLWLVPPSKSIPDNYISHLNVIEFTTERFSPFHQFCALKYCKIFTAMLHTARSGRVLKIFFLLKKICCLVSRSPSRTQDFFRRKTIFKKLF